MRSVSGLRGARLPARLLVLAAAASFLNVVLAETIVVSPGGLQTALDDVRVLTERDVSRFLGQSSIGFQSTSRLVITRCTVHCRLLMPPLSQLL